MQKELRPGFGSRVRRREFCRAAFFEAARVAKKNALAQCEGVVQMSSVAIDGDCSLLEEKRLPVC